MQPFDKKLVFALFAIISLCVVTGAQDLTRDLKLAAAGDISVTNRFGRVTVRAEAAAGDQKVSGRLTASSTKAVAESEIKMGPAGGHITIEVIPVDPRKRIDLSIILPERSRVRIETLSGAVEVSGNLELIEANTETGTIAVDVPPEDLTYKFLWTQSRPRYLADFNISDVKEKSAGRFEIKGRRQDDDKAKSKKAKVKTEDPTPGENLISDPSVPKEKPVEPVSRAVSLNLTTERGIILLNVPTNEVLSDLRERPLTQAAKAIIRSGDSLLMEAIRRASPKYFGDYTRTLPPVKREPAFADKVKIPEGPSALVKRALVRVTDLNNRAIGGLKDKDFDVVENNVSREIISVEPSSAPFNLVLLLDVSGSVENYVNFIRKAARNFVDTVDTRDRVSIVIFNEDVKVLSKFTTDKNKLSESLDTFDAGGGTAYYDALAYTVSDTLRPLKGERTAIVILTDGDDNRSFLAFDSLVGSIQESGALVYPLYVPSGLIAEAALNPNAEIDPLRRRYMSLTSKSEGEGDKLARVSGGVYYPITQIGQIQKAYEDIVLQLRTAYSVTFRSDAAPVGENGVSPRLKIKIKRENAFATLSSVAAVGGDK